MAYVRRVVYPREAGVGHHDGWLSYEPALRIKPEAWRQQTDSFRVGPRRHQFSVYHHGFWVDHLGWIVHPEPDFSTAWVPAFTQQLLESFRTRRKPHIRPHRVGKGQHTYDAALALPSQLQLQGGYRIPRRASMVLQHAWVDDLGGVFANLSEEEFQSGYDQLIAASFMAPKRKQRPHDLLLWDVNRRTAGAFTEDVTVYVAALAQALAGFRSGRRPVLDVRGHEWVQTGWTSYAERAVDLAQRVPAFAQLAGGFRVSSRGAYQPAFHDWEDAGSWISQFSEFDPALFPGILDLLRAFRMDPGRRLDVRRIDTPQDAWLATAPIFFIPLWSPAFIAQDDVYRMPARRVTLDTLRLDWSPDMGFLHDVLSLEDAEPFTESQVAERWAGSVRRRQRSRRR